MSVPGCVCPSQTVCPNGKIFVDYYLDRITCVKTFDLAHTWRGMMTFGAVRRWLADLAQKLAAASPRVSQK